MRGRHPRQYAYITGEGRPRHVTAFALGTKKLPRLDAAKRQTDQIKAMGALSGNIGISGHLACRPNLRIQKVERRLRQGKHSALQPTSG